MGCRQVRHPLMDPSAGAAAVKQTLVKPLAMNSSVKLLHVVFRGQTFAPAFVGAVLKALDEMILNSGNGFRSQQAEKTASY